jgi:hypothetical protein
LLDSNILSTAVVEVITIPVAVQPPGLGCKILSSVFLLITELLIPAPKSMPMAELLAVVVVIILKMVLAVICAPAE